MTTTESTLAAHVLEVTRTAFRSQKRAADKALAQVKDADMFRSPGAESNSLAVIMRHLAGNMRSRWRDFLTTDGEKPDRNRDEEFETGIELADLKARWEDGWTLLFQTLDALTPDDLQKKVTIRGEPHTVIEVVYRQLAHYGNHVGQIIYLAKLLQASEWQTLSIPKGKSADYAAKPPENMVKGGLKS